MDIYAFLTVFIDAPVIANIKTYFRQKFKDTSVHVCYKILEWIFWRIINLCLAQMGNIEATLSKNTRNASVTMSRQWMFCQRHETLFPRDMLWFFPVMNVILWRTVLIGRLTLRHWQAPLQLANCMTSMLQTLWLVHLHDKSTFTRWNASVFFYRLTVKSCKMRRELTLLYQSSMISSSKWEGEKS